MWDRWIFDKSHDCFLKRVVCLGVPSNRVEEAKHED